MLVDVLGEAELKTAEALFGKAFYAARVVEKDMLLPNGRYTNRVQCTTEAIIDPMVDSLLPHIPTFVPGFMREDIVSQYIYWLGVDTDFLRPHLDEKIGDNVVAVVFSFGASGVLGIQPIRGDLSEKEYRDWLKVVIKSNSLYVLDGQEFVHKVQLQIEGSVTERAILVLFVKWRPLLTPQNKLKKSGRPLLPSQKPDSDDPPQDEVYCKALPLKGHYMYHDDEVCNNLKRGNGGYFTFPRTAAIEKGYTACQMCVKTSNDEDLDPDDGDAEEGDGDGDAGDDGDNNVTRATIPEAHDDEATDTDISEGACEGTTTEAGVAAKSGKIANAGSKVEGRASLIPEISGAGRGLFPKPGVVFMKGDVVCRMPGEIWRRSKSKNLHQNPLAQLQDDEDLPLGYEFQI